MIQQKRILRGILKPYSLYFTQILNIKSIENIVNLSPTFYWQIQRAHNLNYHLLISQKRTGVRFWLFTLGKVRLEEAHSLC